MDMDYYNYIHEEARVTSVTEAHDEGFRAYRNGLTLADNPFNTNDEWELNQAWEEGYVEADWDAR